MELKPVVQPRSVGETTYLVPRATSPGHIPGCTVTRPSLSPGFPVLCPVILCPGAGGILEIPQPHPGEYSQDPPSIWTRVLCLEFLLYPYPLPKETPKCSPQP